MRYFFPLLPNSQRARGVAQALAALAMLLWLALPAQAAPAADGSNTPVPANSAQSSTQASSLHESAGVHHSMVARRHHRSVTNVHYRRVYSHRRHRYYERFTGNSFATDQTTGDVTDGEDATVRQAAIDALGDMNGTVVVINPNNGRILAMVNQKLALSSGAEPCSTIKLSVALAALEEGVITKDTPVALGLH